MIIVHNINQRGLKIHLKFTFLRTYHQLIIVQIRVPREKIIPNIGYYELIIRPNYSKK